MPLLADGTRRVVEVTVPYTEPWRTSKAYGWQKLGFRLYYQSTHWVEAIETGPTGEPWYRVVDDLAGSYHVDPLHVRPIPPEELAAITPEIPLEKKRIEVNLTMQTLTAFENDKQVLKTTISSGIPNGPRGADGLSTKTPQGDFRILEKDPAKHMGNGESLCRCRRLRAPRRALDLFLHGTGTCLSWNLLARELWRPHEPWLY
jgi:hypothetical protein